MSVLQLLGIISYYVTGFLFKQQFGSDNSSTPFNTDDLFILMFGTIVPAVFYISLMNIVGLLIYESKHKSEGIRSVAIMLSFIFSLILCLLASLFLRETRFLFFFP